MVVVAHEPLFEFNRIAFREFGFVDEIREAPAPLVVDHEADFVGIPVKFRQRRHVGVADDVVSEALETLQLVDEVLPVRFFVAEAAEIDRAEIFTEKVDAPAVQMEFAVPDREVAEAEPLRTGRERSAVLQQIEGRIVEERVAGLPSDRVLQPDGDAAGVPAGPEPERFGRGGGIELVRPGFQRGGDRGADFDVDRPVGRIFDPVIKLDRVVGEMRGDQQPLDADRRREDKIDILPDAALDVADAPLGTVGAGAEPDFAPGRPEVGENLQGEKVFSGLQEPGDVDLPRNEVAVVAAGLFAVDPERRFVADGSEPQQDRLVPEFGGGEVDGFAVPAFYIGLVLFIDLRVFPVPVERNGDFVPLRIVEAGLLAAFAGIGSGRKRRGGAFKPRAEPFSVQRTDGGEAAAVDLRAAGRGEADLVRPDRRAGRGDRLRRRIERRNIRRGCRGQREHGRSGCEKSPDHMLLLLLELLDYFVSASIIIVSFITESNGISGAFMVLSGLPEELISKWR